jgi:mediator of RNA polymerase II transcription subunit 6
MTLTQDLQKVHGNAADMQFFAPSSGYSYGQRPSKRSGTGPASARASRFHTPLPEAADDTNGREQADDDTVDENDFLKALSLSIKYEDDYMDLNPLSGEPGSLVLSATQGHLRAEKAAKALAASQKAKLPANAPAAQSPLTASRRGARAEKEKTPGAGPGSKPKRRKSRTTGSPEGD